MGTQFYMPFAGERAMAEAAIAAPIGTIFVDVSASVTAYWKALNEWWTRSLDTGEDIVIIEHDVICRPDVIEQFESCDCVWATFPYANICHPECQEAWRNQLGLTRFRAELIRACPDAVTSIPDEMSQYNQLRRDYHNLCDELAGDKIAGVDQPTLRPMSLRAARFTHHWHFPPVEHLH